MIDLTTYTDDDLDALRVAVLTEQERRQVLTTAQSTVTTLASRVEQAIAEEPALPWTPVIHAENAVPPGGKRIWTDGHTYRNDSKQWLSHSPEEYPRGWTCLDPDPVLEPEPNPEYPQWKGEWNKDASYVPNDHVSRNGIVYKCLIAHGAAYQGTWGPPATGVWVVAD